MTQREQLVEYILQNHLSTTDVADALGKRGLFSTAKPLSPGQRCAGPGFCVFAYGPSNWHIHSMIRQVPKGSVVYVSVYDCDRAVLGDLIVRYILGKRQAVGVVVDGFVRDAHELVKNYPVWAKGVTPIGVGHEETKPDEATLFEISRLTARVNQSALVCDDSGVVIVENFTETMKQLEAIRHREVAWHSYLDDGLDTFDFVCKPD